MTSLVKKDFCCDEIYSLLSGDEHGCEIHFKYFSDTRDYAIPYKKEFGHSVQVVKYCPWCGSKLPQSLAVERENILTKEYGFDLENNELEDFNILPEFKTDEWWKNRGL